MRVALQEIPHPDEVVGGGPEEEGPIHEGRAVVVELPELADGLQPLEDFLDAFPASRTHRAARVAGGPAVEDTPAMAVDVLRDMGRDSRAGQSATKLAVS